MNVRSTTRELREQNQQLQRQIEILQKENDEIKQREIENIRIIQTFIDKSYDATEKYTEWQNKREQIIKNPVKFRTDHNDDEQREQLTLYHLNKPIEMNMENYYGIPKTVTDQLIEERDKPQKEFDDINIEQQWIKLQHTVKYKTMELNLADTMLKVNIDLLNEQLNTSFNKYQTIEATKEFARRKLNLLETVITWDHAKQINQNWQDLLQEINGQIEEYYLNQLIPDYGEIDLTTIKENWENLKNIINTTPNPQAAENYQYQIEQWRNCAIYLSQLQRQLDYCIVHLPEY